jgi:hypothetical protein
VAVRIVVPRDVGLRLVRADEELKTLTEEVRAHLLSLPYRIETQPHPSQPDWRRGVLRIHTEIPAHWSILISECVHHWRAALDNFVNIVSKRQAGHDRFKTEFPIFLDRSVYEEKRKTGTPTPRSGLYRVRGLGPQAQAIIESLQPYHGALQMDPLWMLHELDNADKHRVLHAVGTVLKSPSYIVKREHPDVTVQSVRFFIGPKSDGAALYDLIAERADPTATIDLDVTITYEIAFQNRRDFQGKSLPTNGLLINLTLTRIRDAVWSACSRLRRFAGRKDVLTIDSIPLPTE